MTERASSSQPGSATHLTRLSPRLGFDSAAWRGAPDVLCVLIAFSLPWSTTLVAIFIVVWLLSLIPAFDASEFAQALRRPASALPVALFVLAVLGTLWAADIAWSERLHGIAVVSKLLLIPFFIYHFERSGRGLWIAIAFLASCTLVMLASWAQFIDPRFAFNQIYTLGVPVKNPISQSQELAFCAFGIFGAAMLLIARREKKLAAALIALGLAFIADMIFVASSRTVLVCIPVLLLFFAFTYFERRGVLILVAVAIIAAGAAWATSPILRARTTVAIAEFRKYSEAGDITSIGQRLEYWRKSIRFFAAAPVIGNGTGAIRSLFERDAVGRTGLSAEIIANPHNQTLNVAVQWGAIGIVLLYAMWFVHLRMFAGVSGLAAWIGLVAVVENFVSSIFNSHLFDFVEGWIYVLAVGVAGGMVMRARKPSENATVRSTMERSS